MTIDDNKFECYVCKKTFTKISEPILHYDEKENLKDEDIVSVCNNCSHKIEKSNELERRK